MSSGYIRFAILNVLYETFEADGSTPFIRTNKIQEDPELNYLNDAAVHREISYLGTKNFLIGGSSTGYAPFSEVRLNGEGIDIVLFILKNFPLFIKSIDDDECQVFDKQLTAINDETNRRQEIVGFIKRNPKHFEDFLDKTNAISSSRIPIDVTKIKQRREKQTLTQESTHSGEDSDLKLVLTGFKWYELLKKNLKRQEEPRQVQAVTQLFSLLGYASINLGAFGKEGEQFTESKISHSADIIAINPLDSRHYLIDCTITVPNETKITKIKNTARYLDENCRTNFKPVIVTGQPMPIRENAGIANVAIIDSDDIDILLHSLEQNGVLSTKSKFSKMLE